MSKPTREPVYQHQTTLASGIPLGGLGTGSVELRPDGCFHDWEIFNNHQWSGNVEDPTPEMWSEDAFFAIRAQPHGQPPRIRLLYDDDKKSRATSGWYDYAQIYNYPFLRYVSSIRYTGRHPFAMLEYEDPGLPLELKLRAFTPFIPFNAKDSGLPMAFFVFDVRNTGNLPCDVSLMYSLRNCVGHDLDKLTLKHDVQRGDAATVIHMSAADMDTARRTWGTMAVAALGQDVSLMSAWTDDRGLVGFQRPAAPAMSQLFYPLRDTGRLAGSDEPWQRSISRRRLNLAGNVLHGDRQAGWRWRAAVCRQATLAPGEATQVVFAMSWHFPNHYHYATKQPIGHAYANWFSDAGQVMEYGVREFARLHGQTQRFCDEFYRGTLDPWLLASLNAQLTTFPQSFWWTKDGDLAGWEGSACCQIIPNVHTVWSSFQPLLFFPEQYLANKRRAAEFVVNDPGSGGCCSDSPFLASEHEHRTGHNQQDQADLGGWFERRWKQQGYVEEDFRPRDRAARLSRGGFLFLPSAQQLLRDYQWTGERRLLDDVWPHVKQSIERGMAADRDGDGLADGAISFLTYDHWFPPATNCYRGTMWLADLRCAATLAGIVGDTDAAEQFSALAAKASKSFDRLYWNGSYYSFAYDPRRQTTDRGCLADQVSGQLYVRLCEQQPIHDPKRASSALQAVFQHNRRHEEGLLNGADPDGPRQDWGYFARFSERGDDEALSGQWVTPWTGTEYYVAATMMAEGLVEQGLAVAWDVYERSVAFGLLYNHMECGEHYFRPMAAWAMLYALQGLAYDAPARRLTFAPRYQPDDHDSILILPNIWGRVSQTRKPGRQVSRIRVIEGSMTLADLRLLAPPGGVQPKSVRLRLGGSTVACSSAIEGDRLILTCRRELRLSGGALASVVVEW
jgi:uncharacterized protein (DUF608 family)